MKSAIPQDQPQPDQPSQGDLTFGFKQQQESSLEEIIGEVSSEIEAKTRASVLYPLWVLWGLSHEPTLQCGACCGGDRTRGMVQGTECCTLPYPFPASSSPTSVTKTSPLFHQANTPGALESFP